MNYYIWVLGCQMNKSDSERIASILEEIGYKACSREEDADLIVVVACSVRQTAVDRIYGKSVKYKKYKKNNPRLKTILTGCILDLDKKKLGEKFDAVCDIREIGNFFKKNSPLSPFAKGGSADCSYLSITPKYSSKFQAFVPIMTGCNNFCSYCVVPYTRGREYSRPFEDILEEVKKLIKNGYKEITLIGQNVNSYKGSKHTPLLTKEGLGEVLHFPNLLRIINSIPENFWIRFATSHPKDMSDNLIDAIAGCDKVCPYIHLPIQSGSDKILKAMNRKYTKKHYLNLIKKIKEKIPNVMLSTDIIVGFPGESEKDFNETSDVFKKVKYTLAYIARYSPRNATAAAKLENNVPHEEKAKREHILTDILEKTALENNKEFIGKTVKILVERKIKNNYIGTTAQFTNVKFTPSCSSKENLIGKFVDVKITKATSFGMEGGLQIL